MAKTFSELQALALQIRDEIIEKKNTAPRVGAALLDMIDNTIQNITDINQKLSVFEHVCSGFKRAQSESQLPVTPPENEKAVGYLVGTNLYLYVGKDGNAVNGRYFNVGDITGPQGEPGPQGLIGPVGPKGEQGNSGVSGSTDNIEVVNNLDGGESTPERIKVLAAEQGKVLKEKFSELGVGLGYCYQGVLEINRENHTFTTTFSYGGVGKKGAKSMNKVIDKTIVPRTDDGSYHGFWVAFLNWETVEIEIYMYNAIPSDLKNLYVVATGVNWNEDCVIFSTSNITPSVRGIKENFSQEISEIKENFNQEISEIKDNNELLEKSYGLLLGNMVNSSDFFINFKENLFNTVLPDTVIGANIERTLSQDLHKYVYKVIMPVGSIINGNFPNTKFATITKTFDAGTELYVSLKFKSKIGDSSFQYPDLNFLINGTWAEYYNSAKDTWESMYGGILTKGKRDGNWQKVSYKVRATSGGAINNISLAVYLGGGNTEHTATEESILEFTDIYIGMSENNSYNTIYNEEDFVKDEDNSIPIKNNAEGCVFMSLGDSITTESSTYYIKKLRQLLKPSKYYNLAVSGAHWADYEDTIYDGNPVFAGSDNNHNNVIGNQLQKIINNPETFNVAPDIIIIAASTNDGNPLNTDATQNEIITEIDSHFQSGSTPIPITSQTDVDDTYKEHRQTIAGAMRYVICTLQEMYPKARIYVCTPIQGAASIRNYSSIELKQRYLTEVARRLGVPVIHVGEECGIQSDWEYGGAMWSEEKFATEQLPKNGRDLIDGLHPNNNGGWKMANYNYRQIVNDYIKAIVE